MNGLCRIFSDWGIDLSLKDVPRDVQEAARRALIDTIGVTAAAASHPLVQKLSPLCQGHGGKATALGMPAKTRAEEAAFLNGAAAHAWDFDDTSYTGIMHGSAVIFPVVLALSEELELDEESFLAAFIAGSETTYTLADICTHAHYFKGWWSTITLGLIGATVAASRLLGLTADQCEQALGLAAATAGGGKCLFGTDGKAMLVGETARRAIGFARAARAGICGPKNGFEDSRGFFALLNGGVSEDGEIKTLGQTWRLTRPGLLFKSSPVCSAAQAAIEQMTSLMRELSASPDDIEKIEAEIPELVRISLVYDRPKTDQEAQFSLPYALACACLHGKVRLADLTSQEITSDEKHVLMDLVSITQSDDLSTDDMRNKYPESARIRLRLKDGRVLEGFCGEAYGMPGRPMSDKDLLEKFSSCLTFGCVAPSEQIDIEGDLKTLARQILSATAD